MVPCRRTSLWIRWRTLTWRITTWSRYVWRFVTRQRRHFEFDWLKYYNNRRTYQPHNFRICNKKNWRFEVCGISHVFMFYWMVLNVHLVCWLLTLSAGSAVRADEVTGTFTPSSFEVISINGPRVRWNIKLLLHFSQKASPWSTVVWVVLHLYTALDKTICQINMCKWKCLTLHFCLPCTFLWSNPKD